MADLSQHKKKIHKQQLGRTFDCFQRNSTFDSRQKLIVHKQDSHSSKKQSMYHKVTIQHVEQILPNSNIAPFSDSYQKDSGASCFDKPFGEVKGFRKLISNTEIVRKAPVQETNQRCTNETDPKAQTIYVRDLLSPSKRPLKPKSGYKKPPEKRQRLIYEREKRDRDWKTKLQEDMYQEYLKRKQEKK